MDKSISMITTSPCYLIDQSINHFSRKRNLVSPFAFTILMILANLNTEAQTPGFAKEYFIDSTYNWPFEIIQSGSNYWVCGASSHTNIANAGYLIEVDSAGNELWQHKYPNTSVFFGMEEVNELFYVQDGWNGLLKIDGQGNETSSAANTLPVTYDLAMIPTGAIFQTGAAIDASSNSRFGFSRLNNDGSLAFAKWIDSSSYGYGTNLRHDGDKLIYGCGAGVPGPMFTDSAFTVAFLADTNGTIIWRKKFDTINNYVASEMLRTVEGGFVFYGSSTEQSTTPVFLMKTDYDGNFEWMKTYSNLFWSNPHCLVADSTGIAFLGMNGIGYPEDSVLLVKTDLLGEILFTRSFSGLGGSLIKTSDNGYLIGLMNQFQLNYNTYSNLMLIKTDSMGLVSSVQEPVPITEEIKVYPNPAGKTLTVELNHVTSARQISLVDLFGRVRQQSVIKNKITLDVSNLPAGIYFLKVMDEKGIIEEVKTVMIE